MSQQSKIKREKYAKEQEKKGKKVVESIFWLLVLGLSLIHISEPTRP